MDEGLPKKKTGAWNLGSKGWVITIISAFFWISGSSLMSDGLNTLVPILSGKYGWDTTSMMLAATIGGWVSVVALVLFGRLAARFGAKICIIISCVGMIIAALMLGLATSLALFYAAVILYCFVAVGASGIGVQVLGAEWFPRKKGIFMGISTVGITLGAMTINIIILNVVKAGEGMALFSYYYCGFIALILLATILFVKNTPEEAGAFPDNDPTVAKEQLLALRKQAEEYRKTSEWTIAKVLKCRETWMITLGWGLVLMCAGGMLTQMVPLFMSMGHDMSFGVYLFSTLGPSGLIAHPLGGWLDTKFGTKNASYVAAGGIVLGSVIILLAGTTAAGAAIGALCILAALSMGMQFTMSITTSIWGRYDFPNAWTIISITTKIIQSAGIVLVAMIAEITHSYMAALVFMIISAVASVVFIALTRVRPLGRTEEEMAEVVRAAEGPAA
jgi:MFS family permease